MEFPKWKYCRDGRAVIVADRLAEEGLEGEWADSPAAFEDRSLAVAALKELAIENSTADAQVATDTAPAEPVVRALIGKALRKRK